MKKGNSVAKGKKDKEKLNQGKGKVIKAGKSMGGKEKKQRGGGGKKGGKIEKGEGVRYG